MKSNITQLDIKKVEPYNGESITSLNTNVVITFTRDLDKSTILRNILVIEDLSGNITTLDDLSKTMFSYSDGKMSYINPFKVVQGVIEYENTVVTFKPNSFFESNKSYCVIVRSEICSIYGETLFRDYIFKFNTKGENVTQPEEIIPPTIDYPIDFSILNEISNINLLSSNVEDGILVQISTTNDFNNIVFEYKDFLFVDKIIISKELDDGNYCIRTKTLKSDWSPITNVYVQKYNSMPVSIDDPELNDVDSLLGEIIEEEIEVKVHNLDKRISSKTNKLLLEINKLIDMESIDYISLSLIEDVLLDEEIIDNIINLDTYTVYQDLEKEKTFIVIEV